jgi:hypothetical protein
MKSDQTHPPRNIESKGEGKEKFGKSIKYPGQYSLWTEDPTVELPIRLGTSEIQRIAPTTVVDEWKNTLENFGKQPALSVKRKEKWV